MDQLFPFSDRDLVQAKEEANRFLMSLPPGSHMKDFRYYTPSLPDGSFFHVIFIWLSFEEHIRSDQENVL